MSTSAISVHNVSKVVFAVRATSERVITYVKFKRNCSVFCLVLYFVVFSSTISSRVNYLIGLFISLRIIFKLFILFELSTYFLVLVNPWRLKMFESNSTLQPERSLSSLMV